MRKKMLMNKNIIKPYFIAIPTTSGTGSEVTSYSVITDTQNNVKIPLKDDEMLPDVAILDCEFTKSVPPTVTADTGMDVLTHAIEAFISKGASDCTDALSQMAIEYVFKYLLNCYKNGEDIVSREKIHSASCMAGVAFENASLGLNHSLAHAFGAKFKVSHGKANAIFLPYVIKYNSGLFDENDYIGFETCKKYAKISRLLGLPTSDLKEGVIMLIKSIKVLNNQLNIPLTIQEMGINEDEFEYFLEEMTQVALKDVCTQGNPRVPVEKDIYIIFKEAYYGR
jgi:acetaldehyde dehydrogenase/alcohol dehydrogenase